MFHIANMNKPETSIGSFHHRQTLSSTSSQTMNGINYEKDLKVDKRILEVMRKGGNNSFPSAGDFFGRVIEKTQVEIDFSSTFKDRQGNEIPIVKVMSNNVKNLEAASALIMEYLDPHRDKMTFNIDVPYNDHSYIIGKDGSRIKQLSRETGCHIHLPDCNKTSGKKSNKLSIAGTSFESIEQARNQIRRSLPLNVGFKARFKSRKFVHIDTSSSEVQAIKRKYRVDVTFTNVISTNRYTEVTINVKGGRAQLEEIKHSTQELYQFVTGEELFYNQGIDFTITIDVSHSHHQYVKGKNSCNLKVIHQRSKSIITFPPNDIEANQVIIQGKDLISTVMGWQELMGYLPLLLSFDVNFDISKMQLDIQRLEKEFGVGIRIREKLCGHVYTALIKTQERHSICLQEIRQRILNLKSKAEKMCSEEPPMIFNWNNFKNLTLLENFVQYKVANVNNVKSFNSNYYNSYPAYSNTDIESSNYQSTKMARISVPADYSLNTGVRGLQSSRKLKCKDDSPPNQSSFKTLPSPLNKQLSLNDTNYSNFINQYKSDSLPNEMVTPEKTNHVSPQATLSPQNAFEPNKNIPTSPLKLINFDENMNQSFDTFFPMSHSPYFSSPRPPFNSVESKVDYSFSRFTYQQDSGTGSSIASSVGHSTISDELCMNQENAFPRAIRYHKNFNGQALYPLAQSNV